MAYGNPDPTHPIKFVKGLITPPDVLLTTQQGSRFFAALLYEFWGFCVNGTADNSSPGGFAAVSGTVFPSGFGTGSNVVVARGSDGSTQFGSDRFNSNALDFSVLNATGALYNKYLVTWKPGESSTDDSVYRIIGVDNASTIRVDVATGGTTRFGAKAHFSDRSNIMFRVVDLVSASQLAGWSSNHHMVLNLSDAPAVNPGQAVPQFRVEWLNSQSSIAMTVSPSGSWNGSTFTDASTAITQSWFPSAFALSGSGIFYMAGGRDFLITHHKGIDGTWNPGTSLIQPGMHVEVPQRLYSQDIDPNPIAWLMWVNSGAGGSGSISTSTGSYGNSNNSGFQMIGPDGVTRAWSSLARVPAPAGTHVHYLITAASGGLWDGISFEKQYSKVHYNSLSGTYMSSDVLLYHTGTVSVQQYSPARVRLRRLRLTGKNTPDYIRLGERWIHIGGGIMWPWDGSKMPMGLFWEGGGALPGSYQG